MVGLDIALALAKAHWSWAEDRLDGRPTVLADQREPDWAAIHAARVTLAHVMQAGRNAHGLSRLDQIEAAILETDGTISVIPKPGHAG